ncbi:class I SAM-dependent methyltransferase [Aeromicrobium sp. PE09-221]|uniref:methyltransferase n=1 Tax=Aeromicrobium sp. PE09-221 TaxID=1898043 RepID=UPI001F1C7721|nr:class I SAM-dependent methyltransferase [Aeromicrobium sp. PE09-221]
MKQTRPRSTMTFGGLEIVFDDRVLHPRDWTVAQSWWAEELLATAPAGPVLELCAGAGQIGLLAVRGSDRRLVMVDRNPIACDFASFNAETAGLSGRVTVRQGEMERCIGPGERFALVLADPPWVRSEEVQRFPEDPVGAIDGGDDGLRIARSCLALADRHLLPGGSMLLQLGDDAQIDALAEKLDRHSRLHVGERRSFEGRGVLVRITASGE